MMGFSKFDLVKASRKLSELEFKVTLDNLFIDVLWFRAMINDGEWTIKRHMHSSFEFHFIASGACRVIHDDGEFETSKGEFYITAPSVNHEQMGVKGKKLIEYSINCDLHLADDKPSEAKHILSALSEVPCKPFKDTLGVIRLFRKALNEAYYQNLGFYNNIKSLLVMIISMTARMTGCNPPAVYKFPLKTGKNDYRLGQIQKFIEDNISNPINTTDIARYMFLSDKQVCRIVKESMGISTKELIELIKLQRAREFLKDTNLSIKQISNLLGFSSEYYFNQFFKRKEGYPPGIFRKNIQNV